MTKREKWLLVAAIGLIVLIVLCWPEARSRPRNVEGEVRRLLQELEGALRTSEREDDAAAVDQAVDELAALGEAAVPTLTEALMGDHSGLKNNARLALHKMGPKCHAAWPALIYTVGRGDFGLSPRAASVLEQTGVITPAAVPGLIDVLRTSIDAESVDAAHKVLVKTARRYPDATLPFLVREFNRGEDEFQLYRVLKVLIELGPVAESAVPVLQELVTRWDGYYLEMVARALGAIGPAARPAAEALRAKLATSQGATKAIQEALTRIEGPR